MDLMYLLYTLLRKKWIIVGCTILGLAAGFVFTMFRPKEYVSLAQYSTGFTMEQKVKITQEETFNIYEIDLRFNNLLETFRSPKVSNMLSYKLLLHDLESPNPFRVLTDEQKKSPVMQGLNLDRIREILHDRIRDMELINPSIPEEKRIYELIRLYGYDQESMYKRLVFERAGRTDFLNIFCRSENPELSAYVVNTVGGEFIRFFNSIYGYRTQVATGKLDSLVAAKKADVDSLRRRLENFRTKIGPSSGSDKAVGAMTVVQQLYAQYQSELAKLNNLRGEMAAVEQQLKDIGDQLSFTPSGGNNNADILRLQNANRQLESQKVGKTADEVKKLQEEIDANTQKIIQLNSGNSGSRGKETDRLKLKQDELLGRKVELQQQILASEKSTKQFLAEKDRYENMITKGGGDDVLLRAMENDLDLAEKEYQSLRQSMQSSLDLDVNPQNNFKQTLVGQPAYQAESSKRIIIMGLAAVLTFFFTTFFILLLEFMDTSYKTPTMFQRSTKLPLLSAINRIDLRKSDLKDYFDPERYIAANGNGTSFVENLRKLRYELEHSGKKIFLVTSTRPREGKTLIIESLANSFSLSKKKILLVDANFSNNALTRAYEATPALEQFSVNGQQTAVEKFFGITSMTNIPNTDMVGCKEGNYTPNEVLPRNNLLENLDKIAHNYDFIFIEGAALNTHADSKELSKYAEGILAVFSAKSGLKQSDKDSIQFLQGTGEKFVGAILNQVEPENLDM